MAYGLSCCVFVLAVLGLGLGAAIGRSSSDGHYVPSVSHAVAMARVAVRPPVLDADALPTELAVVTVALVGVLIGTRRVALPVRVRSERRQGRAPPGGSGNR
jgi:hypothetical protein